MVISPGSAARGFSGVFDVNLFRSGFTLGIKRGKIEEIADFSPRDVFDGNPRFPEWAFLQLVFGRRRFRDLAEEHPDVFGDRKAAAVFDGLFPPFTGTLWKVV